MVSDSVTAAELDILSARLSYAGWHDDVKVLAALRRERDRLGRIADLNGEAAEALAEQLAAALRRERDELRGRLALVDAFDSDLAEAREQIAKKDAALQWYADAVAVCRRVTSDGDDARHALDRDGGQLARAALAASQEAPENRITPDGEDLLAYARSGEWKAPNDKLRALYREGQRLMREGVAETATTPSGHAWNCDYHLDQYEDECTCKPAPAISDGCQVNPVSSRGCERGTKGCEVRHAPAISGGEIVREIESFLRDRGLVMVPREPTEAMMLAGATAWPDMYDARATWLAMIDAALAAAGQKP